MITTTLGHLVAAQEALMRLAAMKTPVRAAYHLNKLLALVSREVQTFEDVRVKTIKELGHERADQKDVWDVLPEHTTAWQTRMVDLASMPVTLEWGPFDLAWLGEQEMSVADVGMLGPLVRWGDGEAAPKGAV